jgi:hypothetical protein
VKLTKFHVIQDLIDQEAVALEIAKNKVGAKLPIKDLLLALNMDEEALSTLLDNQLFIQKVATYAKELTESGESFAMKARIIAEDLLGTQYRLLKDPETPASVVVAGIANIVRWGGLEKRANEAGDSTGNRVSINISLDSANPKQPQTPTITIEQEVQNV